MFCMLLRKHMSGARLLDIEQTPLERVATLRFEALNELGDRVERRLVLEAISHKTNLLLLDGEGRILDCIRHTVGDLTAGRLLQPGMFYRLPTSVDKENPLTADRAQLEALLSAAPEEAQADKWLLDTFGGLSPLICRELAHRAGGATEGKLLYTNNGVDGRPSPGLHLSARGPIRGGRPGGGLARLLPPAGRLL